LDSRLRGIALPSSNPPLTLPPELWQSGVLRFILRSSWPNQPAAE
jgi:hypothetical protein